MITPSTATGGVHVFRAQLRGVQLDIIEMIRIHLVRFRVQNRTFGPYLASMHRVLISSNEWVLTR
jgi:hypothetical protein